MAEINCFDEIYKDDYKNVGVLAEGEDHLNITKNNIRSKSSVSSSIYIYNKSSRDRVFILISIIL